MDRKMYQLTEKQLANLNRMQHEMPSNDDIKARAKRERKPWGILKRDITLGLLKTNPEYVRGIWQARVDQANGLDYSEERTESSYNLGYYRGYTDYESHCRGGMRVPAEYL